MIQFLEDTVGDEIPPTAAPLGRNFLLVVWQRKAVVFLGVLVGLAVAVLVASRRAPIYQSSAQVLVIKKRVESALPMAGADPRPAFYEDYLATNLALIRSEVVIERAVTKGNLQALPSFASNGNPAGTIMGSFTASRDAQAANIIAVSYRSPVAEDCPAVINAVIASYKDFLAEAYQNVSEDNVKVLTEDSDRFRRELAEKQEDYAKFRKDVPVPFAITKDGSTGAQFRFNELQTRLLNLNVRAAELEERIKALEKAKQEGKGLEAVRRLKASPTEKAAEKVSIGDGADRQLLTLQRQKRALLRDFGEDHPGVKRIEEEIQALRESALLPRTTSASPLSGNPTSDPVADYLADLRQELSDVQMLQSSLSPLAKRAENETRQLDSFTTRDKHFQEDIARLQQRYEQTMTRLEAINRVKDIGGYDARTITKAGNGTSIGTGILQTLLAGGAMGLLLGLALAYLADLADKSFRNPEEVRLRLGLPIIGHIPYINNPGMDAVAEGVLLDASVASFHRPTSAEAEAYRSVRTSVLFTTRNAAHSVLQVTSPNASDGKTTLAANLAVALAQSGKRVVLVDADMRRPRVHRLFGLSGEPSGLSSAISGLASLEDTVFPSGVDNLSLMPCGPRPANPAELLSLPRFDEILHTLRQRFDIVLVDTPPLLAVTDPAVVASRVDAVLLTLRIGKNGRPAAERAKEILVTLGARILGVVVNGVGDSRGYGYGSGYGYTYRYGYNYAYKAYAETTEDASSDDAGNGTHHTGPNGRSRRGPRGGWLARLWS